MRTEYIAAGFFVVVFLVWLYYYPKNKKLKEEAEKVVSERFASLNEAAREIEARRRQRAEERQESQPGSTS